jgi:hypothetical protein
MKTKKKLQPVAAAALAEIRGGYSWNVEVPGFPGLSIGGSFGNGGLDLYAGIGEDMDVGYSTGFGSYVVVR